MIKWKSVKNEKPEDGQACFITTVSNFAVPIIGPITYKKEGDGWLDFFATPEGGAFYKAEPENVEMWWCKESDINLPEEESESGV